MALLDRIEFVCTLLFCWVLPGGLSGRGVRILRTIIFWPAEIGWFIVGVH